jgi:hypothetical protein
MAISFATDLSTHSALPLGSKAYPLLGFALDDDTWGVIYEDDGPQLGWFPR